jgi:hypothetical protein
MLDSWATKTGPIEVRADLHTLLIIIMTRLCFGIPHEELLSDSTYRRFTELIPIIMEESLTQHPSEMIPKLEQLPSSLAWFSNLTGKVCLICHSRVLPLTTSPPLLVTGRRAHCRRCDAA